MSAAKKLAGRCDAPAANGNRAWTSTEDARAQLDLATDDVERTLELFGRLCTGGCSPELAVRKIFSNLESTLDRIGKLKRMVTEREE